MSFQEVNRLRKSGHLEKAAKISNADMLKDPNDEWNKRGAVWVYYDYMKIAAAKHQISEFLQQLEKISNLKLSSNEKMAFDAVAWSVGKLLFANEAIGSSILNKIFELIRDFNFSKPNESYSFLLNAFKKHSEDWHKFIEFVNWWGLDNFQRKDYESFVMDNGLKIPSLVESIYIAVSKKLLGGQNNKKQIEEFLPLIKNISVTYKNMKYTAYYFGLLLLKVGDKELFLKAFIPFVKRNKKSFWVWSHLAEAFDQSSQEYLMCLYKSMSCDAPDKFTISVRENLANALAKRKMHAEAKYEYEKIVKIRNNEKWPLKDEHKNWYKLVWWNSTIAVKNNRDLYRKSNNFSANVFFVNEPEYTAVVVKVNPNKKVFEFSISKEISGYSVFSIFDIDLKKGDFVKLRLMPKEDEKSNFYKLYSLSKTKEIPSDEIYKTVEGKFVMLKGNSFGFVNNVYVSSQIINEYHLENSNYITATAIQTYNPKRKAWGWNVIDIIKKR